MAIGAATSRAPSTTRAKHLRDIELPMLFLSGTRDTLADPDLLRGVVAGIGPRAELVWLDTADHGYKVLKRGTPVRTSDGVQIGTVRRAQAAS